MKRGKIGDEQNYSANCLMLCLLTLLGHQFMEFKNL